jgi:hypothetical protein
MAAVRRLLAAMSQSVHNLVALHLFGFGEKPVVRVGLASACFACAAMTDAKSQMKLVKVVFTGPDDETLASGLFPRLAEIAQQYPHVEFGMLIARGEFGKPRYPTAETLTKLCDFRDSESHLEGKHPTRIDLSVHVCNDWARELAAGSTEVFDKMGSVLSRIPRIQVQRPACSCAPADLLLSVSQLNFSRWQKELNREKLFAALKGRPQEFVFQLPRCSPASFSVLMPLCSQLRELRFGAGGSQGRHQSICFLRPVRWHGAPHFSANCGCLS